MTTKLLLGLVACALIAGIFIGCKEDAPASLFDPNYVSGPQPKVTSIEPASNALAGVTTLTINGSNFSTVKENNLVFFDKLLVPVLQASTTQLQVTAPNLPKDSIQVKVAVPKSDLYSAVVLYKLNLAADEKFGNFGASEEPVAVECDTAGNAYVSMLASGLGIGIKKFTPAGVRSDYSPAFSGAVASWRGMKFGPGGAMFCGDRTEYHLPCASGRRGVCRLALRRRSHFTESTSTLMPERKHLDRRSGRYVNLPGKAGQDAFRRSRSWGRSVPCGCTTISCTSVESVTAWRRSGASRSTGPAIWVRKRSTSISLQLYGANSLRRECADLRL